jgi:hypothetical protein
MFFRRRINMKRFILAILIALCWLFINEPLNAANILYFTSSPTSWIGQGRTMTLTSPTTVFSAQRYSDNSVSLSAGGGGGYVLTLVGPGQTSPTVGFYSNATRWPFEESGAAGLCFMSPGCCNNTLTGYFNVLQADFDLNKNVVSFAVDFMQYDECVRANWVSGSFRYNSDIAVPEPTTLLLFGIAGLILRNKK